jgi:type II secretory pathway component GspD/PulD (secretin)
MKKISLLVLVFSFVSFAALSADEPESFSYNFKNVPLNQVLDMFKNLSGRELLISSDVGRIQADITLSEQNITKADAVKRFEKVLLEQARIVVTVLDDKRISVTFNDALPVTPLNPSQPSHGVK